MLTVKDAAARIRAKTTRLPAESVALGSADGRVLARDVVSRRALPPFDNSAMDGFAVRAADLPGTLAVVATIAAGQPPGAVDIGPGQAARIMTGAPVPPGADAVVMKEDADDRGDAVHIAGPARPGQHIRRAGEDVAVGDVALAAGLRLGPGEIGLLAALGCTEVPVGRRPRVGILSTGDELVDVDVEPGPGQIVNSNAYALAAQVREAGGEPVALGIAPDDAGAIRDHLARGLALDVLCTSGGVSVGDYDLVKPCLEQLGVSLTFWKVAMKPGKPLAFGVAPTGTLVFGLPGNPVSSMVVFELFVRPTLLYMQGSASPERRRAPVTVTADYAKKPGRAHYVRAALRDRDGELAATPNPRQGSGMLRSMVGVDALLELDADRGDVRAGDRVPALLLLAR